MSNLAVISKNGSSGKSTSAQGVGGVLARWGLRVRFYDLDDQQDLTQWTGHDNPADLESAPTIYDVLTGQASIGEAEREVLNLPTATVVPSPGKPMEGMAIKLAGELGAETILASAVNKAEPVHVNMFDCHGGTSIFTVSALLAANGVLTVSNPRGKEAKGIQKVLDEVELMRERRNHALRPVGIIPCEVPAAGDIYAETHQEIIDQFGDLVTPGIRKRAAVDEAFKLRTMVVNYARAADTVNDYTAATAQLAMNGAFDQAVVLYLAEREFFKAAPVQAAAELSAENGRPALKRFVSYVNEQCAIPDPSYLATPAE